MTDDLRRLASQLDDTVNRLMPIFGQGYGNAIERLTEQLEIANNPTKYAVVCADELSEFTEQCNVMVKQGWRPQGGVSAAFIQAFVR